MQVWYIEYPTNIHEWCNKLVQNSKTLLHGEVTLGIASSMKTSHKAIKQSLTSGKMLFLFIKGEVTRT